MNQEVFDILFLLAMLIVSSSILRITYGIVIKTKSEDDKSTNPAHFLLFKTAAILITGFVGYKLLMFLYHYYWG